MVCGGSGHRQRHQTASRTSPEFQRTGSAELLRERYIWHLRHCERLHVQGYLPNLNPILQGPTDYIGATNEEETFGAAGKTNSAGTFPSATASPPPRTFVVTQHAEGRIESLEDDFSGSNASSQRRSLLAPGSVKSSIFNLTSATLGAGALSIPYAIAEAGIVVGLLLMTVIGYISTHSTQYLIYVVNYTEYKTYEEMAAKTQGRLFALVVEISIIMFCFGTAVGYLISVGDIVEGVLQAVGLANSNSFWIDLLVGRKVVLMLTTLFVLLPLSMVSKLTELRFTCVLGVGAIILLAVSMIAQLLSHGIAKDLSWRRALLPSGNIKIIRAFSLVLFAFACQSNVPAIYCELENQNCRRMVKVAKRSVVVCWGIYITMAAGFLNCGVATQPNIMLNYSPTLDYSWEMRFAFVSMALAVAFAYPMNIFPCRYAIEMVIFYNRPHLVTRGMSNFITVLVVSLSLLLALYIPSISSVFELIGATSGAFVSFILPEFFFVRLCPGPLTHPRKIRAILLGGIGIVGGAMGTCSSMHNIWATLTNT